MAGRNMLLRYARLYAGGYDLSGDHRSIGDLINKVEHVDQSGWDEDVIHYLSNMRRQVGITGYKALLDDAVGKSVTALQSMPATGAVSVALGNGAAPVALDLAYILPPVQMQDIVSFEGGLAVVQADWEMDAAKYAAYYNPIATILMPLTALTITTSGTIWDGGAAGTNGWCANLHITATAAGNFSFAIKQSATGVFGGEEDTLATFALNGGTITSAFTGATGAVKRYRRLVATRTGGTCSAFCAMAVN